MENNILFEHNQKAYQAAVEMLEQTKRAAVIHPTGTGKSFIAFQLCVDNAGSKVCFLSPSEYIFKTQVEKWAAAGGVELKNVEFVTYARLMRMGKDELGNIEPDYIILDEFHRCGAAQWGGGVERLREMYPDTKVLGLSATNIRYLDNQRDMAWELFGGNVASELTLGAAVVSGILPAPKYVLSVYSYQKELQRYEMRVRQARNKAVRDAAEKELEALRRALEKADGLADVFARHMLPSGGKGQKTAYMVHVSKPDFKEDEKNMPGKAKIEEFLTGGEISSEKEGLPEKAEVFGFGNTERELPFAGFGKYLVFCANYEHLLEMRELAPEWFAKVDSAPHIYTAYSDDPTTSAEFEAFKADTSAHLKLLYCIDMLNEGIHVDDVDGVILLRPTVSPTIYKQQIGRALASGGKKIPVIFDIVMNIENLYSIGAIEEELREAVFAYRTGGRGGEIVHEHFQIIDELGDCRRLFAQLNETLGASWESMYAMAKEYYEEHGNLEIPGKYATADGYSLGAWVLTQRKIRSGKAAGCLSGEQIARLDAIGMRWQGTQEAAWERNFAEAEKYFKEHGNLDVPADYVAEGGCRLGRWLRRQKEVYQKLLEPESVSQDVQESVAGQKMQRSAQEKQSHNSSQGVSSGNFSTDSRQEISKTTRKGQSIHMERVKKLTQIGMVWKNEDPWEHKFELAKQYYEEYGNLRMAADYVVEGVWLDRWLREQKGKNYNNLTAEQKDKLFSIGIRPGVSQSELSWREQYSEAEKFYRTHGNLSIPKRYTAHNGKNLGIWLQHQRANRKNGRLAGWQVHLLDGLGMVWEAPDAWKIGLAHAKEYVQQNGNLEVPNAYICADGYRLGKWISNQRCAYGALPEKRLTQQQINQLETLGMIWNAKRGRKLESNLLENRLKINVRNSKEGIADCVRNKIRSPKVEKKELS